MSIQQHHIHDELGFHERLQQELSTYTEKIIHEDGSVTTNVVQNPYFLVNDTWNVNVIGTIPNFKEQFSNYKQRAKNIRFEVKSPSVNLEIKYVWYNKLFRDEWTLTSAFVGQTSHLRKLTAFLNEKYPSLHSLLDLEIEKAEREWMFWLSENGVQTQSTQQHILYGKITQKTPVVGFLRVIYSYLFQLTDTREEWEKDRWDVRILQEKYGIDYNKSDTIYYIDFTKIEQINIREQVKKYIKQRLLSKNNFTWGTARNYMFCLPPFIKFIFSLEPTWNDLKQLKRFHMEQYIQWLREYTKKHLKQKNANPERYISESLTTIQKFLGDIQRYEYDIAPETPVKLLIFPEDKPKQKKKSIDRIDYIPDYVLEQLFAHINDLCKDVQPVIWVAFKTGLRISDVLGLKQDCLVKLNGKYYIETDIEKTYVQGHRVPIDDELANILAVLIDKSIKNSNDDNNPEKYIFVRYHGSRKGKPYSQHWVKEKLNLLAKTKHITDENGHVFHFKTHQFRHTYAVKMLNSGADILTVQELLAHASPEMTMRYAKLLDNTKRKAFEEAIKQGLFSFDLNGEVREVKPDEDIPTDILETLWRDHKLNAIDNPYGTCHARINGKCPFAAEPPCLTCNGGSPCKDLAIGFSELDIQKYELLIKTTTKTIEALEQRGRHDMVEKNKKNLERYEKILSTIKEGNIIFGRLERIKRKQGVSNG
ncbi:tyrosine-type recombinase/integrase [Geobacillus thermodenitrificans]|uniref:Transposition regulatory protein TnpB n=1 Tax=Geobacillus thermodenitrificans (strain NG80-2) TaxID=420246 RepID=A4ITV5_GEOTN|nr:tyrosine-type recombinase/integrase [Geobacillus thermodenitrificans]ABO68759.1 Transposition regulatory protein TnpB [Geobacillus thermodenitrificans NG80-2]